MWIQKIRQEGGSKSLTLPAQMCRDLEINRGDVVVMNYDRTNCISLRKLNEEQVRAVHEIYGKDMAVIN